MHYIFPLYQIYIIQYQNYTMASSEAPTSQHTNPIIDIIREAGINYKAPVNLSSLWNFGVYSLVCLLIQIISGIVLGNALYSTY